jgi:hypothetical protein
MLPTMSIEEIAYHEAGHATMSIILELPMNFVTIDKAGDLEGLVDPGDDYRILEQKILRDRNAAPEEIDLLRKYAMVIYAGPMSHGLFMGIDNWPYYLINGNDNAHVYQILKAIYHSETATINACGDLRFNTMLVMQEEKTMEKVMKIAEALLSSRRKLTLQECKDLL